MTDVTVLLPVYNGERYLRETMQSILEQTYQDFEFLIVDDGSTDGTAGIIGSFSAPRIRVLCNTSRLKLSGALNRGINEARGNYIETPYPSVRPRKVLPKDILKLQRKLSEATGLKIVSKHLVS